MYLRNHVVQGIFKATTQGTWASYCVCVAAGRAGEAAQVRGGPAHPA